MTSRDFLSISIGNLWRMKLRAFLTMSGVVIAISAFVTMLSLAAGMQQRVNDQFDQLGLFTTMRVYPRRQQTGADSAEVRVLDNEAMSLLSQVPGVKLAYPYDAFQVTVHFADTQISSKAQTLPITAIETKLFSRMEAGRQFASDSAGEIIVTEDFLDELEIEEPDSVVGKKIVLSIRVASLDSAFVHIFKDDDRIIWDRFSEIRFESLTNAGYRGRLVRRELGTAAGRFVDGFMNARAWVADTLVISGVMEGRRGRSRTAPIIVPFATGRAFSAAGFSGDLPSLISAFSSGGEIPSFTGETGKTFSRVTLDLEFNYPYPAIRDSIEAMGYRVFSYAEEFEEIRQFFTFFYLGLGVIGLIALAVASLGIINTMLMSITERRREIGVLRSLGADANDIRLLFLVESGVIGSLGAIVGILFGWLASRLISFAIQQYMDSKGVDPMEMFALPFWLILTAFFFGLIVSLAAGYYPSSRAAKVDPVQALRGE